MVYLVAAQHDYCALTTDCNAYDNLRIQSTISNRCEIYPISIL